LTCPVCSLPLEPIAAPLPVHGCTSCGGAWLGPEAAVHLLRDEDDAVNRGIVAASEAIPFDSKPHPEPDHERTCALCALPMSTLRVGTIKLENARTALGSITRR